MTRWLGLCAFLLGLAALGACASDDDSTTFGDGAGGDAAGGDGSRGDARPDHDAPFDAADVSCGGGQVRVNYCCGGALPACLMTLDGGACPEGSVEGQCWSAGPTIGCAVQCTPPPPSCAAPADCEEACGGSGQLDGTECLCLCA